MYLAIISSGGVEMMNIKAHTLFSKDLIKLFQKDCYEKHVLNIMNMSKIIFPFKYQEVKDQSNGECDYVCVGNGAKFDAKLPFRNYQVYNLVSSNDKRPNIEKWIKEMMDESSEFDPPKNREDPNFDIANTKLFLIMKDAIVADKPDENIIFFLPFPVVPTLKGSIIAELATDFLDAIYDRLDQNLDLLQRNIYVIYPIYEKNVFAVRQLGVHPIEYLYYDKMECYFTYEKVSVSEY